MNKDRVGSILLSLLAAENLSSVESKERIGKLISNLADEGVSDNDLVKALQLRDIRRFRNRLSVIARQVGYGRRS